MTRSQRMYTLGGVGEGVRAGGDVARAHLPRLRPTECRGERVRRPPRASHGSVTRSQRLQRSGGSGKECTPAETSRAPTSPARGRPTFGGEPVRPPPRASQPPAQRSQRAQTLNGVGEGVRAGGDVVRVQLPRARPTDIRAGGTRRPPPHAFQAPVQRSQRSHALGRVGE